MKLPIITERLILRKLVPEDLDDMFLLDSNPDVVKYVGIKPLTKKKNLRKSLTTSSVNTKTTVQEDLLLSKKKPINSSAGAASNF